MQNSTLFPLNREPLKPAAKRPEPVIWLKRLVILNELNTADVNIIRDLEFQRGLNIIQTRQMSKKGGPVAGHSVGKTLLMRLIRYSIGEAHFGTQETEIRVSAAVESGHVVAHWSVAGKDWIVVRPIGSTARSQSFALRSDDWKSVVDSEDGRSEYQDFTNAVSQAVLSKLPPFALPRGREVRWLDALAWLARDYQCGFRKANYWRHEEANSGPSLDLVENKLIMQWLMGMMTVDEIELFLKRDVLSTNRQAQKRTTDRADKKLETLWPAIQQKLELPDGSSVSGDQATFSTVRPVKIVKDRIKSFELLKEDRKQESSINQLEQEFDAAREKATDAEAAVRSYQNTITYTEQQINKYEANPLLPYARCQHPSGCWMHEQAAKIAADPAAKDHLTDLRDELADQKTKLKTAKQQKKKAKVVCESAAKVLEAEKQRLANVLSGIDELIGRWKGFESDADTYQETANSAAKATRALEKVGRAVDESLEVQEDVRRKHRTKVKQLSEVYEHLLQQIFGTEAVGRVQLDGKGLLPAPDEKLSPNGAAMSVMTRVLAFDIACLTASLTGLGHHPRFLIHDSPREGEMQAELFQRLFEIVVELEGLYPTKGEAAFQYIVTTSSDPPDALTRKNASYVVETLDALSDDGRLLRVKF